jgi:hypothetical protein
MASDAEELSRRISARAANTTDPAAPRFQDQQARLEELRKNRAASLRIVLEYGNTAKASGSKISYATFLKTPLVEGGPESAKNLVARVDFNINPGYSKPTASVREPDARRGAVFEYSMARAFPCFITVHFRSELGLPKVEIQYYVQDSAKTARRIIVDSAASGSTVRLPKQVDFQADPACNGWISCFGTPEVTYLPENEPASEALAAVGEPIGNRAAKPKAKGKTTRSSASGRSGSLGAQQNRSCHGSERLVNSTRASATGGDRAKPRVVTPSPVRRELNDALKAKYAELDESEVLKTGLDCDDLAQILQAGNPELTHDAVRALFEHLSPDEHGRVSFAQVCDFAHEVDHGSQAER